MTQQQPPQQRSTTRAQAGLDHPWFDPSLPSANLPTWVLISLAIGWAVAQIAALLWITQDRPHMIFTAVTIALAAGVLYLVAQIARLAIRVAHCRRLIRTRRARGHGAGHE